MVRFCNQVLFVALIQVLLFNSVFAVDLHVPTASVADSSFGLQIGHARNERPWPNTMVPEWQHLVRSRAAQG